MKTTYTTTILGFGKHASIEIPQKNLDELGSNKRAPLKVTVNSYTYQSTATAMNGVCMVVFPTRDREEAGVDSGDTVQVTLELDSGFREVNIPTELSEALKSRKVTDKFNALTYSKRKEFARVVSESKAPETKSRHIDKIINLLENS